MEEELKAIYEPKGRALEYADLACNLYRGCMHGCTYCYAPGALRMKRDEFHGMPAARPGILQALEKDAAKLDSDPRRVLLCFTCDPYGLNIKGNDTTRRAIEILHSHGLGVEILSKAGPRATVDFDLLGHADRAGATLTFTNEAASRLWEPGASEPAGRFYYLEKAKDRGLSTWASLEPVISPEQSLEWIERAAGVVDLFKVGKWNHDARAKGIDWVQFGSEAIDLLEKLGKDYYIKDDLRAAAGI